MVSNTRSIVIVQLQPEPADRKLVAGSAWAQPQQTRVNSNLTPMLNVHHCTTSDYCRHGKLCRDMEMSKLKLCDLCTLPIFMNNRATDIAAQSNSSIVDKLKVGVRVFLCVW